MMGFVVHQTLVEYSNLKNYRLQKIFLQKTPTFFMSSDFQTPNTYILSLQLNFGLILRKPAESSHNASTIALTRYTA